MSPIMTFMLEPAKLQMNCASASGRINLRALARDRCRVPASLPGSELSVTSVRRVAYGSPAPSPRPDEAHTSATTVSRHACPSAGIRGLTGTAAGPQRSHILLGHACAPESESQER